MVKYEVTIEGRTFEVEIESDDGRRATVSVDGTAYQVDAANVSAPGQAIALPSVSSEGVAAPPRPAKRAAAPATGGGGLEVRAPMPGSVLEVIASPGQAVSPGDVLLRVEAMKMENDIKSEVAGTVKEVLVSKGDDVVEGAVLVVLEG